MHSAPSSLCSIALYSLDHDANHIVYSVIYSRLSMHDVRVRDTRERALSKMVVMHSAVYLKNVYHLTSGVPSAPASLSSLPVGK